MEIRKLTQEEKQNAMRLAWEVFLEFEAPEYCEEGIRNFQNFIEHDREIARLTVFGAWSGPELLGIIALRGEAHLSLFFVRKAYHRQGVGGALFQTALEYTGACALTVHSSPYAVEIYRKLGFSQTGEEQVQDGIRYTPMRYIKKEDNNGNQRN